MADDLNRLSDDGIPPAPGTDSGANGDSGAFGAYGASGASGANGPSGPVLDAMRLLFLDRLAGRVTSTLDTAGVPAILLKGATFGWLHEPERRHYADVDVMVASARLEEARTVLKAAGFVRGDDVSGQPGMATHAEVWYDEHGTEIDLHHRIVGVEALPDPAWEIWSRHTATMALGGRPVRAFDRTGQLLHVVLHAAQSGVKSAKPQGDLQRALARIDDAEWQGVAELAAELEATTSFGLGLRVLPEGSALADRLRVDDVVTRKLQLQITNASAPAVIAEWLTGDAPPRTKLAYIWRYVFPDVEYMRTGWAIARRGPLGLAIAYPIRIVGRLPFLVRGLGEWLRAANAGRRRGS